MTTNNYIFDLSDNVTRTPVTFDTRYGIGISADLYRPADFDETASYPALIVGAPYGGVKEQGPGIYANELAQKGYVVLTFDPAYNGASEGYPHHLSSPDQMVEDFMAGVDFLGTRPFVDREKIGAIGICGSGGFALSAAKVDPRIKAVATVSMYDISRMQKMGFGDSMTDSDRKDLLKTLAEQRWADFETEEPALTGRGAPLDWNADENPVGAEFGEFYSRPRGYHPRSITQFTMTSTASWMNFALLNDLDWLDGRPTLLVMGDDAHSRYFSEDVFKELPEPKELYIVENANHVDLYDKMDKIPFAKLEDFFGKALK
ncbi:alpha/beta hydrolase [Psychromarinibacter halotolerans]|uniref:Alpha/beta hydrolase n=1 Tax=Psychromarinibacter halotolerans TaxID=1775175 RepID=A0ABV7H0G0_9RHOB|nr:alpha/beta hydrolase [Psychromarinibacter halotolerans]MDF0596275.1 alpha/beta hydrolase [Psychromarinibacter halotolerans]